MLAARLDVLLQHPLVQRRGRVGAMAGRQQLAQLLAAKELHRLLLDVELQEGVRSEGRAQEGNMRACESAWQCARVCAQALGATGCEWRTRHPRRWSSKTALAHSQPVALSLDLHLPPPHRHSPAPTRPAAPPPSAPCCRMGPSLGHGLATMLPCHLGRPVGPLPPAPAPAPGSSSPGSSSARGVASAAALPRLLPPHWAA